MNNKTEFLYAANFGLKKKHLIRKTRQLIQNFKVACHIKQFPIAKDLIEQVERFLIDENALQITGEKTAYRNSLHMLKKHISLWSLLLQNT